MKRNLVLVGLFLFGLMLSAPAWAQVAFQMSTLQRDVRVEGTTEAAGAATLAATSAGSINATSTISVAYAAGSIPTTILKGTGLVSYTLAGVTHAAAACAGTTAVPVAIGAQITNCVISGNTLTITFAALGPTAVGDNIVITGVRVNANSPGLGAVISATATATVPAGAAPITFFITNTGTVAVVMNTSTVVVTAATGGILTCVAGGTTKDGNVTITENFNQAFTTAAQETAFGPAGTGGAVKDTELTVSFGVLPKGVTVTLDDSTGTSTTLGATVTESIGATHQNIAAGVLAAAVASPSDGKTAMVFTIDITAAAVTGSNQAFSLDFKAANAAPITPGPVSVTATVAITSAAVASHNDVPVFVANTQTGSPGLLFGISDCVTNMLFPWVTYAPAWGYDTGIAIANTTTDPFTTGSAAPQTGTCTLTGYPTANPNVPAAGTAVTYTTPSVPSGTTWANSLSAIPAFSASGAFSGYIIAVCRFQNAHAFVQISDWLGTSPAVSQGYIGLIIPNPALVARNPAGAGNGEQLDQ